MTDAWMERLSEYLDGELSASERQALEAHLDGCDACRATLAELRDVTRTAQALADRPPARSLWPGIASRIGAGQHAAPLPVTDIREGRAARRRRFSFSLPQLVAASIALVAISAGSVWLAVSPGTSAGPGIAPGLPEAVQEPLTVTVATPYYDAAVAELEAVLQEGHGRLDPATVRVLQESLATIDRAIAEARAALAEDPSNGYLTNHLAATMRRKLQLLRRAAAIAGTVS
ncbi:MAG: hypothetical protein GTN62_08320 [Gemmatimonadales bacterium]|nr:hypothetical protein [Gemmatimonadales bacterium]NIN50105.1 hypothetical protein [Gemmatimonadales bacterium]NIP07569.1 hypothetical protein [Gemmatimonadales bacterium]NIR01725.1 hypothetical protein [Gemmatimonadales bacterium]NIS65628.1 hypothetical protein [Gemmatimonadales bacterium]